MALKDWFGSGKKKEQLRDAVKEAVSDGRLTEQKRAELEALRSELGADPGDDKTQVRREVYNVAVGAVKAGGKLTPKEEAELARIQAFLNLKDDQVDKTRMDLRRLSIVTQINQGHLPVVSPNHTALKGLELLEGEVPHYSVGAERFQTAEVGTAMGERFMPGTPFRIGMGRSFSLPVKGATSLGEGLFFLTSKRFVFRGAERTWFIEHRQPEDIYFYRDGLRLKTKKGQILFRIQTESVMDVIVAILTKLSTNQ